MLFERNMPDGDPDPGVAALVARLREVAPHLLVSVDEEGGDLIRLDHVTGSVVPGSAGLGYVDVVVVVVDRGAPSPADLLGPRYLLTRSGSSASAAVAAAVLSGTAPLGGP